MILASGNNYYKYKNSLSIPTACTSESSWFLLALYNFKSSMNSGWLTGFISFANLYPALIFRNIRVSGSMFRKNNNGDKESP